ncbi:MAG TPA: hypothetical protein DF292_04725 [Firmicutes bacterium]|jgi:CRISPR-associated protein Csx10|nr:hypothetical protein [Bacillota bacterium]
MTKYLIKVETKSLTLLGSGEGWSSAIDMDIVFDDVGLPYFPARRLKGLLRESTQEVLEMFTASGINIFEDADVDLLFGKIGSPNGGRLILDNLRIPDYQNVRQWCQWALSAHANLVSQEVIINAQTEMREHTSINDDGIAKDNSLRKLRAIRAKTTFEGSAVIASDPEKKLQQLLALASLNMRHVGTSRHKGYGEVACKLFDGNVDLSQQTIDLLKKGVA